jgi:hypothetical protein
MKNKKETKSKIREKINQIYEENEYANLVQNKNRSRSITVGTAFGGSVEVSMRGDYHQLWATLQPVEVVELIEQLASGVGLQVAMRPKQDFAAWRGWNVDEDNRYWAGAAPWQIEDMSYTHKKFLKESRNESELPSDNVEQQKTKDQSRIEEEEKIQEEIQKELRIIAAENLTNLRKELRMDLDEFTEYLNEELENIKSDEEFEENEQ